MLKTASASSQPIVRTVSNVAFAVGGDAAFENAVRMAVEWLRRINPAVPDNAFDGCDFDVGGGGDHPARAVRVDFENARMWSAIVDNPDAQVLGRTWVTELLVGEDATGTHFGTRLLNVTRRSDDPFEGSVPRVAREVIEELPCAADGAPLNSDPTSIDSQRSLVTFLALLENPDRKLPVVAIAKRVARAQFANPVNLARRLAGAAHVVEIDDRQSWALTEVVGRQLSVFDGAARIYAPGFSTEAANPFDHPLWVRQPNTTIPANGAGIISRVLSMGVSRGRAGAPRFEAVRQAAAASRLHSARPSTTDLEMSRLYQEENERLVLQLEELRTEHDQWLEFAERERAAAAGTNAELKADVARQRAQTEVLRAALATTGRTAERSPLVDLSKFGDWADKNVSPNIWFAPKATKEVEKRGSFREPHVLGETILMLDDLFVPMKRNPGAERREAYQAKLEEFGCEDSPCFNQRNAIQQFPEYAVTYRGERYWCDSHIKHGGGLDPRQMFRIYYHWHEEEEVLLIGHLPTHLANNQTN